MKQPTVPDVLKEIQAITGFLVREGVADDQNSPVARKSRTGEISIEFAGMLPVAQSLKSMPYVELYQMHNDARSYNLKMLDGGLVQILYRFQNKSLTGSILSYLPSPELGEYQNDPELYDEDVMFAEVIERQVVAVPVRFDFDNRAEVVCDVNHPASHLTLGQYKNCRIAAGAPVTPGVFVEFILRSFYNTASRKLSEQLPVASHRFAGSILPKEGKLIHIAVP